MCLMNRRAWHPLILGLRLALLLGWSTAAFAGAWTQERGKGLAITTITASRASDAYDSTGARIGPRDFRKDELKSQLEYGLLNGITLVLAPSAQIVSDNSSGIARKERGLTSVDLAMRLRLLTRGRQVVSLEPHVILPGTVTNRDNALLASGKTDFEIRVLYGVDADLLHKPLFFNAEVGYRQRGGAFANEWRADLAAGLSPTRRWQVIAKTSSILSTGTFSLHKAGASLVFALNKQLSLEAGMMRAIAGTDIVRENAYVAGVWVRF
jgi:hypothetical protein